MAACSYKQALLSVMKLLMKHSDSAHRLTQADIIRLLSKEYSMEVSRDCVRRDLTELKENGFAITHGKGGWYWEHELLPSDLDLIIACIQSYGGLSCVQRANLINRLHALGGTWYQPVSVYDPPMPTNQLFIYNLDKIHDAIRRDRRICFCYGDWDTDKCLHPRKNKLQPDEIRQYTVSPYAIITDNSRYYLVCNINKYSFLTHFRIDRILEMRITSKVRKDPSKIPELTDFSITRYVSEHPFMFSGEVHTYRINIKRSAVNDIFDWYGMDVRFENERPDTVDAIVRSDQKSIELWRMRYSKGVLRIMEVPETEIKEPVSPEKQSRD